MWQKACMLDSLDGWLFRVDKKDLQVGEIKVKVAG